MPEHITLTHPKLPGREITVRTDAVPHHAQAGWITKRARRIEAATVRLTKTADIKSEPKPEPDAQSAETKEN